MNLRIIKISLIFLCIYTTSIYVSAQTSGPNNPGTGAGQNGTGHASCGDWINETNAFSSDNTYSTETGCTRNRSSDQIRFTNFGFAIPAGATIDGITVEVERFNSQVGTTDQDIRLLNATSTLVGTDHSLGGNWATADPNTYVIYGGAADNWGAGLTAADINSANFGVSIQANTSNTNTSHVLSIDHVRITVDYTAVGPSASGGIGAFLEGDATPVAITDIVIDEAAASSFANGQTSLTYIILPPAGFTFNAGVGSAAVTGGTDVTVNSTVVTAGAITVTMSTTAIATVDEITVSGIQVILGAATSGIHNPTYDATSTGTWGFTGGESHGIFTVSGPIRSNGTGGGDWDVGASWALGVVPIATDEVLIETGDIINANGNYTCAGLTINGELLYTANNRTITVNGNSTITGEVDGQSANGSELDINGDLTITGGNIYFTNSGAGGDLDVSGNTVINGVSELSLAAGNGNQDFQFNGTFTVNAGADVAIGGADFFFVGDVDLSGELTFTTAGAGIKTFQGNVTVSAGGTWDNLVGEDPIFWGDITNNNNWIGCTGGDCDYTLGDGTVRTINISGNPIQGSTFEVTANTSVINTGDISIDKDAATDILSGAGTFTNGLGGSLRIGAGTIVGTDEVSVATFNASTAGNFVYYQKNADQVVRVPTDGGYANLVCENSGTKTLSTTPMTVSESLQLLNTVVFNVETNRMSGPGSILLTGTSELQLAVLSGTAAVPELTGDYSFGTGTTLTLNGAGVQTYRNTSVGSNTVYHLNLATSGGKTIDGMTVINGDITVSGSATMASHSAFIQACSGTFNYNSSGTTTLNAATAITIGNFSQTAGILIDNANNVTVCGTTWINTAGTYTATGTALFDNTIGTTISGAFTDFNNVTINSGKTLIAHATDMGVMGTFNNNTGTFTHNSGEVTFSNVSSITGSTTTFNDVEIGSGTLTGHPTNFNVEGNWTFTGGTYTSNNGKVTFSGGAATQTVSGLTTSFYDIEINKTVGTKVDAATDITVTNLLTITEGILDVNAQSLNGSGGITMVSGDLQLGETPSPAGGIPELTGTYTMTGGTVTLDGAGAQTLNTSPTGATTYFNLVLTNTGAKTLTGLAIINGDATVSGVATVGPHGNFVQAFGKTFTYTSTGTTSFSNDFSVGNFTQNSTTGTVNLNGNNMTVLGATYNYTTGVFSLSGRVIFDDSQLAAAQTITGVSLGFNDLEINNTSGVNINIDETVNGILYFTDGNLVTAANKVIIATGGSISRTSGHVEGFLQMPFSGATLTQTFVVGTGTDYTPAVVTFAAISVAGDLICSSVSGDHFDILSSDINSLKSVNRYWDISNSGITFTTYDLTLNFVVGDIDLTASTSDFSIFKRTAGVWSDLNTGANIIANATNTTATGNTAFSHFAIGQKIDPSNVLNAQSGAMNWNNVDNWIRIRSGLITFSTGSAIITGNAQAKFTTEICPGDVLLLESSPTTVIGTVSTIDAINQITLTANAAVSGTNVDFGMKAIPGETPSCVLSPATYDDLVIIGNPSVGAAVDVTIDAVPNTIFRLRFKDEPYSSSLDNNSFALTITSNATVRQPSLAGETNSWNINTGIANIGGFLQIASDDGSATKVAEVNLTSGTLNVLTSDIRFDCTSGFNATGVLTLGAGATVNYGGQEIQFNDNAGTISPGTNSTFNYVNSILLQTVSFGAGGPSISYNNLTFNNTYTDGILDGTSNDGIILGAAVTTTNVTGDIDIQTGIFDNAGFAIAGNAGKSFSIQPSSSFLLSGSSVFPTGFGTFLLNAMSNTRYLQTSSVDVSPQTYGNLYLTPTANTITLSLLAGTTTVSDDLIMGNGTNTGIIIDANTNGATLTVSQNATLNANTTYEADNTNTFSIGGNWDNQGGTYTHNNGAISFNGSGAQQITGTAASETFYDFIVNKVGGALTTVAPVTTLTVNDYTNTLGSFTSPNVFNINGNATLTAGTLTAGSGISDGSFINITGDWTNNGATFINNSNTIVFNNTGGNQVINGTANPQSFGLVQQTNTGRILSTGGSVTQINADFWTLTASAGTFTAPATTSLGGLIITSGTYTTGATTNLSGDITYDGGTLTLGANTFVFNGSSDQSIVNGTATFPAFNNLTINNTSATGTEVIFNEPITVNGTLTFTDGNIVTTSTNILSIGLSATLSGFSNASFVAGPMRHTVNVATPVTKVFPVGVGIEMHQLDLSITQSTATPTTYDTEYLNSSADALGWTLPATLDKVSAVGYWDIQNGIGSAISTASVRLYYFASDGVGNEDSLRIAKGNPSTWINIGGIGSSSPAGIITSTINFTTFSFFALANLTGAASNPLPIELLDFHAIADNNRRVNLSWTTASEINNDHFTVERSMDGIEFEQVDVLSGAGNSNYILHYTTTDFYPLDGVSYYRLKQTDFNGEFSYSDLVAINFEKNKTFNIYPNPSTGENTQLLISGIENAEYIRIDILDGRGQQFYRRSLITDMNTNGNMTVTINKKLSAGTYVIRVTSSTNFYNQKLIVK